MWVWFDVVVNFVSLWIMKCGCFYGNVVGNFFNFDLFVVFFGKLIGCLLLKEKEKFWILDFIRDLVNCRLMI